MNNSDREFLGGVIVIIMAALLAVVIIIGFTGHNPEPTEGLTIHAPIGWACFANQTLEDKFLAQSGHEGFNTTVPCPKNLTINPSEDESGK